MVLLRKPVPWLCAALFLQCCISPPEEPPNENPGCVRHMYEARREIASIQQTNRLAGGTIVASFGFGIWIPPLLFHTFISGPAWMLWNYREAGQVEEAWIETYCEEGASQTSRAELHFPDLLDLPDPGRVDNPVSSSGFAVAL